MIMNWKNDPVKPKPTRFNLGGLIKKKITWRRSIDSLATSIEQLQLDLTPEANSSSYLSSTNQHEFSLPESTVHGDSSDGGFSQPLSAATSTSSYPPAKNYTHVYHTEERYTSFTTECISLLNSDMTLHMDYGEDADADDDEDNVDKGLSGLTPYRTKSIDYTDSIVYDPKAEECISDYRSGGYHMVRIGDQYTSALSKYQVLRKLGWGHFSTVWLCSELGTGRFVALKIVKLGRNYSEAAKDEIAILNGLQGENCEYNDCQSLQ